MSHHWCAVWLIAVGAGMTPFEPALATDPPISDFLPCEMIWAGGEGLWSNSTQWSLTCTPGDLDLSVLIDANPSITSLVHLDVNPVIAALFVTPGDALWFQPGSSLAFSSNLQESSIVNSGLIRLLDNSNLIVATQATTVSGSGTIELAGPDARLTCIADPAWLMNLDQTIRGAGRIGTGALGLINFGTIVADVPGEALRVRPSTALNAYNFGMMRAVAQGRLRLIGTFNNHQGQILAVDSGRIEFENALVNGGSMLTDETGVVSAIDGNASLSNVQLSGNVEIGPVQLSLLGVIQNNGNIHLTGGSTIAPPGQVSTLAIPPGSGNVTLTGAGSVHMFAGQVGSGAAGNGGHLIHGAAHRIRGWGPLGLDTISLTNHGLIEADHENPLVLDPADIGTAINQGTMRAIGVGGLVFTDGVFRNNGTIEVLSGSRAVFTASSFEQNANSGIIAGGTWRVLADQAPAFIWIPGPNAVFNFGNVILSGVDSGFVYVNTLSVNDGRFEIRNGRDFTSTQPFFSNGGELVVGRFSTLSVTSGSFTQEPDATLELTVAPENLGEQELRLAVSGSATISGTLKLTLAPQFQPQQGQTFQLISASNLIGSFTSIDAPPGFMVLYTPNSVHCVYTAPCIGDVNGDGVIDVLDLIAIISGWGVCPNPGPMCMADVNGDGVVDLNDLLALMNLWGQCP